MEKITDRLFNSPLEIGLRLLFIFERSNKALDLQRLIYYNYLMIHSSDVDSNENSLHPELPNRACEMLVSRKIVLKGLNLLVSKGIIKVKYTKSGVKYRSCDETKFFATHFSSEYAFKLREKANWLINKFNNLSDSKLSGLMNENLGKWGSEFTREYNVLEEDG